MYRTNLGTLQEIEIKLQCCHEEANAALDFMNGRVTWKMSELIL